MPELRVIENAQEIEQRAVIETLEAALAEAREGNIRAVAIAVVRPDMAMNTSWSSTDVAAPLVAAAALLQSRMLRSLDD